MGANTITFNTNAAQNAKIKTAMDWRMDRMYPDDAPHDSNAGDIRAETRKIMLTRFKSEVRSELADKRREGGSDEHVDDIE